MRAEPSSSPEELAKSMRLFWQWPDLPEDQKEARDILSLRLAALNS